MRDAIRCIVVVLSFSSLGFSTAPTPNGKLAALSEQIRREGGYVHPSLRIVEPAPCGADRGVIFAEASDGTSRSDGDGDGAANGIWLRVPFSYQLTRELALETLTPLIPRQVLQEAPLVTLDDAALLVLLLVHLQGISAPDDKWRPYLDSLPADPGCGWWGDDNADVKASAYDVISKDVITSSRQYVSRVSNGMAMDYGPYLGSEQWPAEWKDGNSNRKDAEKTIAAAANAIKWSLCIVSSRGTAASPDLGGGSTRLVPLADMVNHNLESEGFIELGQKDVGAREELLGTFEVRRRDGAVLGDEITVDYNLLGFSPEDWFLSHSFVPQEVLQRTNVGRPEL